MKVLNEVILPGIQMFQELDGRLIISEQDLAIDTQMHYMDNLRFSADLVTGAVMPKGPLVTFGGLDLEFLASYFIGWMQTLRTSMPEVSFIELAFSERIVNEAIFSVVELVIKPSCKTSRWQ